MNRSRWLGGLVVVAVIAAALFAWRLRPTSAPRYRTEPVEIGSIVQTVSATGTVQPVEQVEVGSQVSGTVQKLNADYNVRVQKGQVLLQLDPSTFRARHAQAEAAVARTSAQVAQARRDLDRLRRLLPDQLVAQADVDAATSTLEQHEADLAEARAQLEASAVDLANTTIRSPIDGVVISRDVELGQTVAASLQAPKLFVIANDLAQMQVETRIDEADIGAVHPGLPVTFTVDAFPDENFSGTVAQVRLEPITEQNVVTYTTVIRTANPALRLKPGMTANVSVEVARRDEALKVPNAALRFRPSGNASSGGRRGSGGTAMAATRPADGVAAAASGAASPDSTRSRWRGAASRGAHRGGAAAASADSALMRTRDEPTTRRGTVYVLRDGKAVAIPLRTGITDGASTEAFTDQLHAGDLVIVGLELTAKSSSTTLQPPPGLGGRGGGGRGR